MKPLALLITLLGTASALAADVEGYVYTIEGTPVAKAAVTAGTQRTTTSEEGHFKITAPNDSVVGIEVRTADFPPLKVLALAGDPPLTITLGVPAGNAETTRPARMAPGAAAAPRDRVLTGVVRIGKKPLAFAPVMIHGGDIPIETIADDKGRYRVTLAPGRYAPSLGEGLAPRLRSSLEGRMVIEESMVAADLTRDREATLDIELVAAPLITGRVLDADQKPVAGADVLLVLAGRPAMEFFHQPIVRTLPDGRFAVLRPPFPETEATELVVTPLRHSPVRSKGTTVTLPRFETVTVRLTGREGKPLPGANLGYATADEIVTFGDSSVLMMPHNWRRRVKADAKGEVVLHLQPGDYELAAAAPRHQQRTVSRPFARAGTIEIALEAGHQIRGRVRRGKQPVAGVHVSLRGGVAPRGERGTITDDKGEFLFDALPQETFTVQLFKHEEMVDKMLTVDAPGEVDVDLPAVATLRGRIIDAETGRPVPQFLFSLEATEDAPGQRRARRGHSQRGESNQDGTFTATVPVGTYRIVAAANGYLSSEPRDVRVSVAEPAFVEIALSRGASVRGRVTDDGGKPLAEAQVMVMQETGEIQRSSRLVTRVGPSSATTGEDGTFAITGVETGPAQLLVRRRGYVLHRRTIEVEAETLADVVLERGLTVTGVVTLHGKPITNASVDAGTSAVGSDHQSAITDERGRFTLEGLIAARYTVNANFETHHAQVTGFDPSRQREVAIELEDRGRGVVFGTVSGVPRGGGKVLRGTVFAQSTERGAEANIDAAGNYRIENAPAGTIDIVAHVETQAGTRSTTRKRVELTGGQELRVDLDLTPVLTVTGRVTHGDAKPVSRAQIVFSNEQVGLIAASTRDDGTYEAGLPAPGRYRIFVHAEQLNSRSFQTIRDIRGSEAFDVHLTEQTIEGMVLDAATARPIANALVTLVPREVLSAEMTAVSAETITDANGRFTLASSASGPHVLIASANGYAQRSQEVLAGGAAPIRAQFALTPAAELRVRVIDARTAAPLDAHLVIADKNGVFIPVRPIRSPDGGEFVFSLAPGKYRVKAVTMGYAEKTVEVSAPGPAVIAME